MSFWDNVKKFTQPYSDDDDYDEYDDEEEGYEEDEPEEAPAPRSNRRTSSAPAAEDAGMDFSPAAPSTSATPSSGFSGQVLNMGGSKQEVVLFHAKSFDAAAKAADELRGRKAVILNMENVDKALTRRVVDFLSGCIYALDGKVKKVAQATYLFCPHNMEITGDLEQYQSEVESYV